MVGSTRALHATSCSIFRPAICPVAMLLGDRRTRVSARLRACHAPGDRGAPDDAAFRPRRGLHHRQRLALQADRCDSGPFWFDVSVGCMRELCRVPSSLMHGGPKQRGRQALSTRNNTQIHTWKKLAHKVQSHPVGHDLCKSKRSRSLRRPALWV